MFGIIIYLYFLIAGFMYSRCLFNNRDMCFSCWMGGIIGSLLLMAGIVIPAMLFDFTYLSHFILMVLVALPLIFLVRKKGTGWFYKLFTTKGNLGCGIDKKVFLSALLPVMIIIFALLTNHILAPHPSGGVASGQCTFGDLQMHLGFITGIAEQKTFPPNYSFLDGYTLNYPFFVNMLSSSLYLFGTSLRTAVLLPSYVISALLVMGFYIIAYRLTKKKSVAVLSIIFFFLGSGFGFAYFLNGAKADATIFTSIFSEYYHTPTNLPDYNLRWVNPICDMIIPQRTTMAGWCMIFPCLWLLLEAFDTKDRKFYIILGIIAGAMPMIHTHTFLALGIICAVMFFLYLAKEKDKKGYLINWVIFGGIVLVMAAPQLFYWTFKQSVNNDSFLRYSFNWVNHNDPYLWFYLKNWGIIALFAVPAIIKASKENKRLLLGCGFIMLISEFILFQPNEYDNNKLIFIAYMILVITVCDWLVYMWDALKSVRGRAYLAVIIIIAGTLSGTLTIIREWKSGADYQTYSDDDLKMAEYIKENTPTDALFLTSAYHLNPVVSLAGRNIYVGSSLYVYFHGFNDEYYKRTDEINKAYSGTYEDLSRFCREKGIDYVYIGDNERGKFTINPDIINRLEKVYSSGSEALYKIR